MTSGAIPPVDGLQPDDPRTIARYRLVGRLGVGGMGVVYLGQDHRGARAAVKLVRPDLAAHPEFRARFAREVQAARRVRGRHTARVLAADTDSARQWVATEYVEGPTLERHVLAHGPMSHQALTAMAVGLADGLAGIHDAGLVHRDLKPSNVILSPSGPRVIDFGIARALDATSLTATGTSLGTLAWMSPEQLTGRAVTSASDTFAWGMVVAYAATGAHPFGDGRPEALAYRIVHHRPDLDGLPPQLGLVVAAALDAHPRLRPGPRDLAVMLQRAEGIAATVTRVEAPTGDAGTKPTVVSAANAATRTRRSGLRIAALAAASVVALGFVGAVTAGAGPLVTDWVRQTWDAWATEPSAAGPAEATAGTGSEPQEGSAAGTPSPTSDARPTASPESDAAPEPTPAPTDDEPEWTITRSSDSAAGNTAADAAPADVEADADGVAGTEQAPRFASSCTWDPPRPSVTWANAVVLTGECDDFGRVSVEAEALTALASETDDAKVLVTGDLGGNELYLTIYPVAPASGSSDPDQRWWSWGGSTNNGRGDPVYGMGTQRHDPATGQTWWELGGDNLAVEVKDELGVDLVTTMGGTSDNFECTGPRGTGSGADAVWPATGEVTGIHYAHDWVDTPMAAAVCSLITHALPASGIATQYDVSGVWQQ